MEDLEDECEKDTSIEAEHDAQGQGPDAKMVDY